MLPHRLIHLNDAQCFGMPQHLHVFETFEWIREDIAFGFLVGVSTLRKDAVFLMNFSTLYGLYNTLKNSTLCRMSTDWSGRFLIMNTPVMLTNAMPLVGRGSVPVLYGDFSGVRIEDGGHDAVKSDVREGVPKGITCSLKGYMGCILIDREAVKGLKMI